MKFHEFVHNAVKRREENKEKAIKKKREEQLALERQKEQ